MFICIANCPELDADHLEHCTTTNANVFGVLFSDCGGCPVGNHPSWQEIIPLSEVSQITMDEIMKEKAGTEK